MNNNGRKQTTGIHDVGQFGGQIVFEPPLGMLYLMNLRCAINMACQRGSRSEIKLKLIQIRFNKLQQWAGGKEIPFARKKQPSLVKVHRTGYEKTENRRHGEPEKAFVAEWLGKKLNLNESSRRWIASTYSMMKCNSITYIWCELNIKIPSRSWIEAHSYSTTVSKDWW